MSDPSHAPAQGRAGAERVPIQGHADSGGNPGRRLSEELERCLEAASEEGFDADRLDALLAALDEADPLPDAPAFDPRRGLSRFHRRRRRKRKNAPAARRFLSSLFRRARNGSRRAPAYGRRAWEPRRGLCRTLFAAAACLLLLSASAGALFLFGPFPRWDGGFFRFQAEAVPYADYTGNPLSRNEERAYASVGEMLDAFGVTGPLLPAWVPDRFGEPEVLAAYRGMGIRFYAAYPAEDGTLLIQAGEILPEDALNAGKTGEEPDILRLRGIDHYLFSGGGMEKAVWRNGVFECYAQGPVSREEMRQIVSSIYEGR